MNELDKKIAETLALVLALMQHSEHIHEHSYAMYRAMHDNFGEETCDAWLAGIAKAVLDIATGEGVDIE